MEKIEKSEIKVVFTSDMNLTLANAIRRSANEVPVLAIEQVDIYKNDSALYDEVLAHRIGLIPLKNQKTKEGEFVEMKLRTKANGERTEVLSGGFGDISVYDTIPLTILEKNQEVEVVAKARQGRGVEHSKFSPGLLFYRNLNKVEIGKEAENKRELAEIYPNIFKMENGKLKVQNEWIIDLEVEDLEDFKGIKVTPTEEVVYTIESWGQMSASEIFLDAIKALNKNLDEVTKALK